MALLIIGMACVGHSGLTHAGNKENPYLYEVDP